MAQQTQLYKLERNLISLFAVADSLFDDDGISNAEVVILVCELMLAGDFVCFTLSLKDINRLAADDSLDDLLERYRTKWSVEKHLHNADNLRAQSRELLCALLTVIDEMKSDSMESFSNKSLLLQSFLSQGELNLRNIRHQTTHPAAV